MPNKVVGEFTYYRYFLILLFFHYITKTFKPKSWCLSW